MKCTLDGSILSANEAFASRANSLFETTASLFKKFVTAKRRALKPKPVMASTLIMPKGLHLRFCTELKRCQSEKL